MHPTTSNARVLIPHSASFHAALSFWRSCAVLLLAVPCCLADAGLPIAPERLPSTNLLVYRNGANRLAPVETKRQWQHRRREILLGMQKVMGPLPGRKRRCALDVRTIEETDCGSFVRRNLSYASEAGSRVPADLLIPKQAFSSRGGTPAILA